MPLIATLRRQKKNNYFYMSECMPPHMFEHAWVPGIRGGENKVSDPVALELRMFVSLHEK